LRHSGDAFACSRYAIRSARSCWLAARPTNEVGLAELKRRFGVTVVADGFGGYVHNTGIHLVDRQGRIVEILDLAPRMQSSRVCADSV
jgi:protein SCO1/2